MGRFLVCLAILTIAFCTTLPPGVSFAESVGARSDTGSSHRVIKAEFVTAHGLGSAKPGSLRKHSHRQRFVEFRGEFAIFPGNTVLRHGFLGRGGEQAEYEAVAFQGEFGIFGLILGAIFPLPAKVGVYPWDDVTKPGRSYQVKITERQHMRLLDYIEKTRQENQTFFLYSNNCVRFARDAARTIGLKAPEDTLILPPVYVNMLRYANGG